MKQLHNRYIDLVRGGPPGLFSRGDLSRLEEHVADGVSGAPLLRSLGAATVVDVGSGGGVPGIPLAVELGVDVHLVESQRWKADFLLACTHALGLESRVRVHPLRAEEVVGVMGRERVDAGVARALAAPAVVAEYLSPLVRPGGHLVLWSTTEQAGRAEVAPIEELGLGQPVVEPSPSPLRSDGVLVVWPKVGRCAPRIPRRPGVAARRPLR